MYQITKEVRTETAHRLLNHPHKCRFLHGHTYVWQVTIEAPNLDRLGMVMDFGVLKGFMENIIMQSFDHAVVLHTDDPLVPALQVNGQNVLRTSDNPTAEFMAALVFDLVQDELGQYCEAVCKNKDRENPFVQPINVLNVMVWETATSFATYSGGDDGK